VYNRRLIVLILIITISIIGCSSEYNQLVRDYNTLYKQTVDLLDSKNVYHSIVDNKLEEKTIELNRLFNAIEAKKTNDNLSDYLLSKGRHESLISVLEKGLKWESLGGLDRVVLQEEINILKLSQEDK